MKTQIKVIMVALGLTTSLALAGYGKHRALSADILAKYDTNADGVLSDAEKVVMKAAFAAEHAARRAEFILKYDTNGDGALDAAERAAASTAIKAAHAAARLVAQTAKFTALDTDGVAGISAAEWAAGAPAGAAAANRKWAGETDPSG